MFYKQEKYFIQFLDIYARILTARISEVSILAEDVLFF